MLASSLTARPATSSPHRLPDARVGEPYEYGVAFEGFTEPIRFRWSAPLPAGLSSVKSLLFGTPEAWTDAPVPVTLDLADALGETAHRDFTLLVRPPLQPLRVVTNNLPVFVVGERVDYELAASGGEGVHVWEVVEAALPAGLRVTLDEPKTECRIVGTAAAVGDIRVRAAVSDARRRGDPVLISGSVGPAIAPPLQLATTVLPPASYLIPYHQPLVALGGKPPYVWSVQLAGPERSAWLGCDALSGILTGTPPRIETVRVTLNLRDALGTALSQSGLELQVAPPLASGPFELHPADLPAAIVGRPFRAEILASNHRGHVSWNVTQPPPWVRVETVGESLRLTGQPASAGNWTFSVQAVDAVEGVAATSGARGHVFAEVPARPYAIQAVEAKPRPEPLRVVTESVPVAMAGLPYRVWLAAAGGEGALGFVAEKRGLTWLEVAASGELSGIPPEVGEGELAIRAKDIRGTLSPERRLTLKVVRAAEERLRILDHAPPVAVAGREFLFQVPIAGGLLPYTVSLGGDLPKGLVFDAREGKLSGTPLGPGRYPVQLSISDGTPRAAPLVHGFVLNVVSERASRNVPWLWAMLGVLGGGLVAAGLGWVLGIRAGAARSGAP